MLIRNTADRFGVPTRLLHWTIAALIIFLIWLGWYMVGLDYYHKWYYSAVEWHQSLGLLVLGLAVLKMGWQLYSPVPGPVAGLRPAERVVARAMHGLLVAIMVLLPVSGYLISTAAGKGVSVFGWFEVPALIDVDRDLKELAIDVHFYLAYATILLVAGHAGAALKHQFVNRDGTLARMLWR